jgi:hypothetical protein
VLSEGVGPERREKEQVPPPPVDQPGFEGELKSKRGIGEEGPGRRPCGNTSEEPLVGMVSSDDASAASPFVTPEDFSTIATS